MKSIYKDNFVYLKSITHLFYETLGEYQSLWFNLIKPANPPLEREYEDDEELPGIQKKGNLFLSELYRQAIIMELTSEKSCCSAGNNQVDEQAGITQHRWQLSRR